MDAGPARFLPIPTPETQAFWDACREHRLLIQRCEDCGHFQFYPRRFCTRCGMRNPAWAQASGYGAVLSWTVVHTPVSPAYAEDAPYVIALVRLQEGPVMMSRITGCDPSVVKSGMPVEVTFRECADGITLPEFRPRTNWT